MSKYWTPLDEELAEKVMGWKLVCLSDPEWKDYWPAWDRNTKMRLAWYAEDPADACCSIEVPPGTGKNGHWQPAWIPRFSTEMNEALRLCEGIRAKKGRLSLTDIAPGIWRAMIHITEKHDFLADDPLPAMAIARVSLGFCTSKL